jgi:hypothetical protein
MQRREFLTIGAGSLLLPVRGFARQLPPAAKGQIIVDSRIELMSIVHLLGGYFLLGEANTTYKISANSFFNQYRSHRVVAMAKTLAEGALSFDAVPDLMLRLTEPNGLTARRDLPDGMPRGIPDSAEREAFLAALRDFARVSGFRRFFSRNRGLYRQITRAIEPVVRPNVAALEAYTGTSLGHWTVIASPLMFDGGFGPSLSRLDGSLETYSIIGPSFYSVKDPDFTRDGRLQDLIVHEFAHSPVNPLAEKQPEEVDRRIGRFEALREVMLKAGAYDNWTTVVNEHVVRAVTARVTAQLIGPVAGEAAVATEVKRGFTYVPALIDKLKIYESDRKQWPNLGVYYSELLAAFD